MVKIAVKFHLDKELMKTIETISIERIKLGEKQSIRSWSSKSSFVEYLLKVGLIHYKQGRAEDTQGVIL